MGKIVSFICIVALLCATVSCGNRKPKPAETISKEEAILMKELSIQIDSLINLAQQMYFMPFFVDVRSGVFTLNSQQQKVQPDYLLKPSNINDLQTLAQKNVVLTMLAVDRSIAHLYGMSAVDYDAAITKLAADVNATNLGAEFSKLNLGDSVVTADLIQRARKASMEARDNGTLNTYLLRYYGFFFENVYILSKNPELFTVNFTDKYAKDIVYRIILLTDLADKIARVYPDMQLIKKSMEVLNPLDAINKEQLVEQLKRMAPQIEQMRNSLLIYPDLVQ